MTMNFWKNRSVLKYLAFSAVGTVLFAGEKCMAHCPISLDGKIMTQLVEKGEAETKEAKIVLDEGSEEENKAVQLGLKGAELGKLEGTPTEEENLASKCAYKIHTSGSERILHATQGGISKKPITIHVRTEEKKGGIFGWFKKKG